MFYIIIIIIIIIISESVIRVVYRQDDLMHKFIKKIVAFPILPAHIQSMFVSIESLVGPTARQMVKCAI